MEKRLGWKAIIYDAPWANFDRNQPGITVSQDGKSCETLDDDRQYIRVVADENIYFSPRNGHILFRQKGTDLYDVVCLNQKKTKYTYELLVDDVQMSECDASFERLRQSLNVYLKKYDENGIEIDIIPLNESEYEIINPNENTRFQANSSYTIIIKGSYLDAVFNSSEGRNGNLTITEEETINQLSLVQFNNTNILHVVKESSSETTCSVGYYNSNHLTCEGGTIHFTASTTTEGEDKYYIDFSNVTCTMHYDKIKCGKKTGEYSESSTDFEFSLNSDGVTDQTRDGKKIHFKVENGVNSVSVTLTSNGFTEEINNLPIPD